MLNANVDALLNVSVADLSVEDNTNRGFCYVVDDTSLFIGQARPLKNTTAITVPFRGRPCRAYPFGQHLSYL